MKSRNIRTFVLFLVFIYLNIFGFSPYAQALALEKNNVVYAHVPACSEIEGTGVLLKGLEVDIANPFKLDFILSKGNTDIGSFELKKVSKRLVDYFLASLTVPNKELWVNLSPDEKERVISPLLAKTELGRDMLEQDYQLKLFSSSILDPQNKTSDRFWDMIRERGCDLYNKVWIKPESATVYVESKGENKIIAYIKDCRLKVLTQDYERYLNNTFKDQILPAIEEEVNSGENFAVLRQIYHSLILAQWYESSLKDSMLSQLYSDQNKVAGIDLVSSTKKNEIYNNYLDSISRGTFNKVQKEYDHDKGSLVMRRYITGGEDFFDIPIETTDDKFGMPSGSNGEFKLTYSFEPLSRKVTSSSISTTLLSSTRRAIDHMLNQRGLDNLTINDSSLELIASESDALHSDNIEWVMRSMLAKTSQESVSDEEVRLLIEEGVIDTTIMLYSPVLKKDNVLHPNRLKKDTPIKGGIRIYAPVPGESLMSDLLGQLKENEKMQARLKYYRDTDIRLSVVSKYTGGLIPGLLLAQQLHLPMDTMTKRPFNFDTEGMSIAEIEEPHLPIKSPEYRSYMAAYPGTGIILVDDEATRGDVLINTIRSAQALDIKTEAAILLLESMKLAGERLWAEDSLYFAINAIDSDQKMQYSQPVFLPLKKVSVSLDNQIMTEGKASRAIIPITVYSKSEDDGSVFVDHPLRGMSVALEPDFYNDFAQLIKDKIEAELGDLPELRKLFYSKGKTLYLLGLTPSGLYPALAAAHSTRMPLIGATNQSFPRGYSGQVIDYNNLNENNYSLYNLTDGDGVIVVSGELTNGEEQIRIIKALADKGVKVAAIVSVLENTYYDGRKTIQDLTGVKVISMQQHDHDEGIPLFNETKDAMSAFKYAVRELESALEAINPEAGITKIRAMPSSFTTGLLMQGSDIDNMHVYIHGVGQSILGELQEKFAIWLSGRCFQLHGTNEKPPKLLSIEHRMEQEAKYGIDELPQVTVYEDGRFKTLMEMLNESCATLYPVYENEKTLHRMRLMILSGELDPEYVREMLRSFPGKSFAYDKLRSTFLSRKKNKLSKGAIKLAKKLDSLYVADVWGYEVSAKDEPAFRSALKELMDRDLVRVLDGKLILLWRLNAIRWSDRFLTRKIAISFDESTQKLAVDDYRTERTELYNSDKAVGQSQVILMALDDLTHESQFICFEAYEYIRKNGEAFLSLLKASLLETIKDRDINKIFGKAQKKAHLLIKLICAIGSKNATGAGEVVSFIFNDLLVGVEKHGINVEMPNQLLQELIVNIAFVLPVINDDNIRTKVEDFLLGASESYLERTSSLAKVVLERFNVRPKEKVDALHVEDRIEASVAQLASRELFFEFESRRKAGQPIRQVISDYDETLLHYISGQTRTLDPELSFLLNWLMSNGVNTTIVTGSTHERIVRTALSDELAVPLSAKRLNIFAENCLFFNDQRQTYKPFTDEEKKNLVGMFNSYGWYELNDGKRPGTMFIKDGQTHEHVRAVAKQIKQRLVDLGYNYDITISVLNGSQRLSAIRVYNLDKSVIYDDRYDLYKSSDALLLFDDGGEFGVDRSMISGASKDALNVNLGPDLNGDQEYKIYNFPLKNEIGAKHVMRALVASKIMELYDNRNPFDWDALGKQLDNNFGEVKAGEILSSIGALVMSSSSALQQNISITGITGDIGGSFAQSILNLGGHVKALVRDESILKAQNTFLLDSRRVDYVQGDLLDVDALDMLVKSSDLVYHLGAMIGQDLAAKSVEVLMTNGLGTALLTDAVIRAQNKTKVIFGSSQRVCNLLVREDIKPVLDHAYKQIKSLLKNMHGLGQSKFYEEGRSICESILVDLPADVNVYDVSKLLGELFIRDLENFKIVRISNAYGPDYHNPRLINRLVKARLQNIEISEVNEVRDFIYSEDLNSILLRLGTAENIPDTFDLASGTQSTMSEVTSLIKFNTADSSSEMLYSNQKTYTPVQDSRHARELLGRNFTDIAVGIRNTVDEMKRVHQNELSPDISDGIIVFDIGGTSMRAGVFNRQREIENRLRVDSPNFLDNDNDIKQMQDLLIKQMKSMIDDLRSTPQGAGISTIAIAFPGPVNNAGIITGAATLWGNKGEGIKFDIEKAIKNSIPGISDVFVLNDNSASVLRYASQRNYNNISAVTIGSGTSQKTYMRNNGGLVMDSAGLTGEIGHLRVDFSDDALLCDCGGKGHLGAIISGRGTLRTAQKLAAGDLALDYKRSILFGESMEDPKRITNESFVKAAKANDVFALEVLDRVTSYLADVLANMVVTSSLDKIILVGGYVHAFGDIYINSLKRNLLKHDFYGRDEGFIEALLELGESDALDNLLGIGYYALDGLKKDSSKKTIIHDDRLRSDALYSKVENERGLVNHFSQNIFEEENDLLASLVKDRHVLVFVDKNVFSIYGDKIKSYFKSKKDNFTQYEVLPVDSSEENKTMETALGIVKDADRVGADRKSVFVGVGGGTLMDTVGFAAQMYRRGVDYVRVPTTLLGVIDAAVGVKVGVNFGQHKNFLGGFYPPIAVVNDIDLFKTTSAREIRSGIAEIIKVALISNAKLFEDLETFGAELTQMEMSTSFSPEMVSFIKEATIELLEHLEVDFYEKDLMRHVDFGHAFAHSLEDASAYEIKHGEAVGIDILISAHIAWQRGILSQRDFDRIKLLFENVRLPFFHQAVTFEVLKGAIASYKEHKGGKMLMVVPKGIGKTQFIDDISDEELNRAIKYLRGHSLSAASSQVGGIEMDDIDIKMYSFAISARFDTAVIMKAIDEYDIDGLTPVLLGMVPYAGVLN